MVFNELALLGYDAHKEVSSAVSVSVSAGDDTSLKIEPKTKTTILDKDDDQDASSLFCETPQEDHHKKQNEETQSNSTSMSKVNICTVLYANY